MRSRPGCSCCRGRYPWGSGLDVRGCAALWGGVGWGRATGGQMVGAAASHAEPGCRVQAPAVPLCDRSLVPALSVPTPPLPPG